MSAPIYPIPLLNDIHQWFPDILYNPGRFRNVQDLLEYIQQVASINPFTRGLQQYYARQQDIPRTSATSASIPVSGSIATSATSASVPVSASIPSERIQYTATTTVNGRPVTARIQTIPITQAFATLEMDEDSLQDENVVVNMINRMLSQPSLQQFLQESVPVVPTQEQIDNASSLQVLTQTEEDNCAICQDSMEEGQQLRILSHCHHRFHKICVDSWFRSNVHCPTCRHDIRMTEVSVPPPVPPHHRRTNIHDPPEVD